MERTHLLDSLSDDDLLRRLSDLLGQSRCDEADFVAHIGEVDRRRLYAREAAPSMFAYCTELLHLSEAEAYLRITAARAAREHPQLLTMLADGRLHLTAITKLAPHLTAENRGALLERATHLSKRQVEELVAELSPRPDAPSLMRKLPSRHAPTPAVLGVGLGANASSAEWRAERDLWSDLVLRPDRVATREREPRLGGVCAQPPELRPEGVAAHEHELRPDGVTANACEPGVAAATVPAGYRPAVIEPLAPARYKVQFTASADLCDKLERLRALMRSSVPDGDLAAIVEQAVTEKLERLEARRFAKTKAPTKSIPPHATAPAATRNVPAAVRRAVYARDGDRCGFVDEMGRRCKARDHLEFHHRHPIGYGGDHTPENIGLRCRTHNLYLAEHDFGREAMCVHRRSQRPVRPPSAAPPD
jgi:hypothetical protein